MWKVTEEIVPNQNNKHNAYVFDNVNDKAEEFNSFFLVLENTHSDVHRKNKKMKVS